MTKQEKEDHINNQCRNMEQGFWKRHTAFKDHGISA
jgi:hypothetical protein